MHGCSLTDCCNRRCAQAEVTHTQAVPPNKAAQAVAESAQKEQPAPFKQYDTDEQVAAFMAMQAAAMGGTVDTCNKHE
ncbi:MAG: hypothetical protein HOH16_13225 [Planctomycetaceae bacterium]|nr:hypothetical protein [Planctomycetaceae bacterium]